MIAAGVAAAAAIIATAVATIVVLTDDESPPSTRPQGQGQSTAASPTTKEPPGQVRVDENGTALTLTWTDPSDGTAPFIVAGGRAGEQPRAMAQITPGSTRYVLNGLNPSLDYCFIVVAVYSADELVRSDQVCTERESPRPTR